MGLDVAMNHATVGGVLQPQRSLADVITRLRDWERAVFLDEGLLVESGKARDLIDSPETARCRAFMQRILKRPGAEPARPGPASESSWT